jgi:hypothetical protein
MSEYSPVAPGELARSVMNALLRQECGPLPPVAEFPGAGLYALYYRGDFAPYRLLAELNRREACSRPIYVGKAVSSAPEGAQ